MASLPRDIQPATGATTSAKIEQESVANTIRWLHATGQLDDKLAGRISSERQTPMAATRASV